MQKVIRFTAFLLCLVGAQAFAEVNWPNGEFKSQYETVRGSKMHYVEYGKGDPILLVHGIPTWSYLWRDMIKPLSKSGRVIAVDLIGYGKSDKPNIEYRLTDLQDYLADFIQQKDLKNIRLVVHDLGGPVALPVAEKLSDRIKGIVAFETILGPIDSKSSLNDFQKSLSDRTGTIGPGGQGYEMIVRQNVFIGIVNQMMAKAPAATREAYATPFKDPLARIAIYRPFQDIPVEQMPMDSYQIQKSSLDFLRKSNIPKLYIHPSPGFATNMPEGSPTMAGTLRNVEVKPFGAGGHFLQEENPKKLASMINEWIARQ